MPPFRRANGLFPACGAAAFLFIIRHIRNHVNFFHPPAARTAYGILIRADIHQNNIRPDLFDIPIAYHIIFLTLKKVFPLTSPRHKQLMYAPVSFVKFQVSHFSKLLAVPQIDNFLTLQFRKKHVFPIFALFILYAGFYNLPLPCFSLNKSKPSANTITDQKRKPDIFPQISAYLKFLQNGGITIWHKVK